MVFLNPEARCRWDGVDQTSVLFLLSLITVVYIIDEEAKSGKPGTCQDYVTVIIREKSQTQVHFMLESKGRLGYLRCKCTRLFSLIPFLSPL